MTDIRYILDAQDRESAFLTFPDGGDRMVLKTVDNPGCKPLSDAEVQHLFNLIDAAPDMLTVLRRINAGEDLTGPGDLMGEIHKIIARVEGR